VLPPLHDCLSVHEDVLDALGIPPGLEGVADDLQAFEVEEDDVGVRAPGQLPPALQPAAVDIFLIAWGRVKSLISLTNFIRKPGKALKALIPGML
jgi:hypothetical protein